MQNNQGETHALPIITTTNLPNKYLEQQDKLEYADNGKSIFTIKLQLLSTTLPQEDSLADFYNYYHLKEFFADDKLSDSLDTLKMISPSLAIRSLPVMIAALVRVFCSRTGTLGIKSMEVLLHVLDKVQKDGQVFRQRTGLLHSFVVYAFDNIKARFPVYSSLTDNFMQMLLLNKSQLRTPEGKKTIHSLSWWVFDSIIKSLAITAYRSDKLNDENRNDRFMKQYSNNFLKVLQKMWAALVSFMADTITAKDFDGELLLNQNMAIFAQDLISIFHRGFAIDFVLLHVEELDKNSERLGEKAEILSLLKLEFLRIISDHEHWIPLNLPRPLDFSLASPNALSTIAERHMLAYKFVEVIIEEIKDCKSNTVTRSAINNLSLLLAKHDFDANLNSTNSVAVPSIQESKDTEEGEMETNEQPLPTEAKQVSPESKKQLLATIYSPLLLLWLQGWAETSKWRETCTVYERREWLVCIVWLLKNLPLQHLRGWWSKEGESNKKTFLLLLSDVIAAFQYDPQDKLDVTSFNISIKDLLSKSNATSKKPAAKGQTCSFST